jgi:aspartate aminotransferase-like enzyme
MPAFSPLLDLPPFPGAGYARIADRIARLLGTTNDVLIVQAEAIVALEAAATSLARPGLVALNVVTSPYGGWFGEWLRRGGAEVRDVIAEPGRPVTVAAVAEALEAMDAVGLVALVHAESATGILNPLPGIAALAKARGALLLVDAVASAGGHALDVDRLGIDICVTGLQKSFGGSSGLAFASVSRPAWDRIGTRPAGAAPSALSFADLKRLWLDSGRGVLPGMPSALEFFAAEAALDRFEAEGLIAAIERHARAAAASRAGIAAMGLGRWVAPEAASNLVTAAPTPQGVAASQVVEAASGFAAGLSAGVGPVGERLVRLNHTGPRANAGTVLTSLVALAEGLKALGQPADLPAALAAARAVYAEKD